MRSHLKQKRFNEHFYRTENNTLTEQIFSYSENRQNVFNKTKKLLNLKKKLLRKNVRQACF